MCDEDFDQIWKLEVHLKKHPTEKYFECDICDKQFALQWRLNKHKRGHTDGTNKFCHYFNNNKNCIFEETIGCMFRHEISPICKDLKKCKFTKCQFTHTSDEHHSGEIDDVDVEETVHDIPEEEKCKFCEKYTKHSSDEIQNCSECEFETKCWAEYNKHWREAPDHIFSKEELREIGYNV